MSFCTVKLTSYGIDLTPIGLANYAKVLADSVFQEALLNTSIYMLVCVSVEFILGLAIALMLNRIGRLANLLRTLFLIPMLISSTIVGLMFTLMYNYNYGLINEVLAALGGTRIRFLNEPSLALPSVMLCDIWAATPFMALVLSSGLAALPTEPIEAAKVDGASTVQTFRYATFPMLKPTVLVALLIRSMDAFRVFEFVYIMTGGGPGLSTTTMVLLGFRTSFYHFNLDLGAAITYLTAFLIAVFCILLIIALRRE